MALRGKAEGRESVTATGDSVMLLRRRLIFPPASAANSLSLSVGVVPPAVLVPPVLAPGVREEGEEAEESAPAPKHGYQYRLEAPLGTQSLVGMRLTYRFRSDEGWLDGVIRSKCTSSGVGQRQLYNVSFSDGDDCTEMKLCLSEYGVNKRWVLWEWKPPTDSGCSTVDVPIATPPPGLGNSDGCPTRSGPSMP